MTRAHIYYAGRVQGVGFRYTVQQFASELKLVGWVKNLADGRVEVMVEGEKGKIEELLERLNTHFNNYIQNCKIDFHESYGQFKSFSVVF